MSYNSDVTTLCILIAIQHGWPKFLSYNSDSTRVKTVMIIINGHLLQMILEVEGYWFCLQRPAPTWESSSPCCQKSWTTASPSWQLSISRLLTLKKTKQHTYNYTTLTTSANIHKPITKCYCALYTCMAESHNHMSWSKVFHVKQILFETAHVVWKRLSRKTLF